MGYGQNPNQPPQGADPSHAPDPLPPAPPGAAPGARPPVASKHGNTPQPPKYEDTGRPNADQKRNTDENTEADEKTNRDENANKNQEPNKNKDKKEDEDKNEDENEDADNNETDKGDKPQPMGADSASPEDKLEKQRREQLNRKFKSAVIAALSKNAKGKETSEDLQPHFKIRAMGPDNLRRLTFDGVRIFYQKKESFFSSHPDIAPQIVPMLAADGSPEKWVRFKLYALNEQQEAVDCTFYVAADADYRRLFQPGHDDPAAGEALELGDLNCLDVSHKRTRPKGT